MHPECCTAHYPDSLSIAAAQLILWESLEPKGDCLLTRGLEGPRLCLKRRLKCDVRVYKHPRKQVWRSVGRRTLNCSVFLLCFFFSVVFRSGLGFIELLQSCLQRFMLGQSCALVISPLPHCFFPLSKTGGSVAADSNFFVLYVSNLSWNIDDDTLREVRLMSWPACLSLIIVFPPNILLFW
jgi:hypothetical protein